jgi:hypothetical protein
MESWSNEKSTIPLKRAIEQHRHLPIPKRKAGQSVCLSWVRDRVER